MTAQPRMLILDYALSPPVINEGIAHYFLKAGCAVDCRPFYPNLVRDDLARYAIIALLAGRTPAFPGGIMSIGEVPAATEFVRNGGTLILGPNLEGGEGANERHLFNRLLAGLDVPIRVCNDRLEDDVNRYAAPLWDRPFYRPVSEHPAAEGIADRLAFDRSTSLAVGKGAAVVLTTFDTAKPNGAVPVIAMAKAGKGLVLVAGRYLLNATGIPLRISGEPLVHPEWLDDTSAFLQRLADYVIGITNGTQEWADATPLPPAEVGPVGPADFDLDRSPVLDRLPEGVNVEAFDPPGDAPDAYDRALAAHYEGLADRRRYGWIETEGIRASWGSTVRWRDALTEQDVARVADALKACGVNLFWDIANCQAVGGAGYSDEEKAEVLRQWEWTASALDGSPVKWYPTLDYRYFREEKTRCYGAQGQKLDAPSPMDLAFWRENWRNSLLAVAEFSRTHPCVGGIAIDVELYAHPPAFNYYMGYGFEDACYFRALDGWSGWVDDGLLRDAGDVQLPDRFNWLRAHGLLKDYFSLLAAEVERICRGIREDVWRINPDLLFASYIFTTPCNWFDMGIYRGFSTPERPLILMTFNVRSGRMLATLRRNRVYAYHASVALLGMIGRDEYATVFANARRYGHGTWMNNINALLHPDAQSVESPQRQGISPEDAIAAIREANDRVLAQQSKGAENE